MNLEEYGFDVLLAAAIKSEIESREAYEHLAGRAKNFLVRERFQFLADEERRHEEFLRKFFDTLYPGKEVVVPEISPVPLPEVRYGDERAVTEIIEQAMKAELAAREFYLSLAKRAEERGNEELATWLYYLANMEKSHYHVLEGELEASKNFDRFDTYWEMMHAGP